MVAAPMQYRKLMKVCPLTFGGDATQTAAACELLSSVLSAVLTTYTEECILFGRRKRSINVSSIL